MNRYDRQLRLWGHDGQALLDKAQICVVGAQTALLQEIFKNLVLAGISTFTWFETEQETNSSSGFYSDLVEDMNTLHPEKVTIERVAGPPPRLDSGQYYQHFNFIILTQQCHIDESHFNGVMTPPVMSVFTRGMCGFVRVKIWEPHFVLAPHDDYTVPDLRLDMPWEELAQFMDSINLLQLTELELSQLPYAVLLYKMLEKTDRCDNKHLKAALIEEYANKLNPHAIHDLNFTEAQKYSYQAFSKGKVDEFIQALNADLIPTLSQYPEARRDWHDEINYEVKQLYMLLPIILSEYGNFLPSCGDFPDMESSSAMYTKLQHIYRNYNKRFMEVLTSAIEKSNIDIRTDTLNRFAQNLFSIQCLPHIPREKTSSNLYEELKSYQQNNARHPSTTFKQLNIEQTYPTESYVAGMVAQETIKFITHQFVPINNIFVYDALDSRNTQTIRQ